MYIVYFATIDDNDFIKTIELQEVSNLEHMQLPEGCKVLTEDAYNVLNANLGDGKKYRYVNGDIVTIDNVETIRRTYKLSILRKLAYVKAAGLLFNNRSFKLNTDTISLVCLYANADECSYYIPDVQGDPVCLHQLSIQKLKLRMAKATSFLLRLEQDALNRLEDCSSILDIEEVYSYFYTAVRTLNDD